MYVSIFERVYREKGRVDVAQKMLNNGFAVDDVIEYTELPREKIEALEATLSE